MEWEKAGGYQMDNEWALLYQEACRLQGEVKISKFLKIKGVACALMTSKGNIYTGVSLASACAAGMCAERNAISSMLTNGEVEIAKIIAVKDDGKIISPCGVCRECMRQLGDYSKNIEVMISDYEIKKLCELTSEWWGEQVDE